MLDFSKDDTFQVLTITIQTIYDRKYAPCKSMDGKYYDIFLPTKFQIDINKIRTLHLGMTFSLPNVLEEVSPNTTKNISKYSIQGLLSVNPMLAARGLSLLAPQFIQSNQSIDLIFTNVGQQNLSLDPGTPLLQMILVSSPHTNLLIEENSTITEIIKCVT